MSKDIKEKILKQYETYVSKNGTPIFLKESVLKAMGEYASTLVSEATEPLKAEIQRLKGLLNRAAGLVGNPGTNISSSTDLACESWQNDYNELFPEPPKQTP